MKRSIRYQSSNFWQHFGSDAKKMRQEYSIVKFDEGKNEFVRIEFFVKLCWFSFFM